MCSPQVHDACQEGVSSQWLRHKHPTIPFGEVSSPAFATYHFLPSPAASLKVQPMRPYILLLTIIALFTAFVMGNDRLPQVNGVKIEETIANPEAKRRTKRGDTIDVHYRGTLQSDGKEFDASYNRGQPLSFTVGKGQVIKGWDEGLLNMAPGEKRTLTIQPEAGYGSRAMGPIPANSVLVFETELVTIKGVSKDEL
ncbi:hypothetical protein FH972_021059 [Carpinus fangiana]|uniref:peptidylprolyl isomerase n=1 Tax=Carpinus fangiana TaxID=176857 RepID=A0A5N6KNV3_9ROSI|nr:hypothetical protein FH972_021059 [Carpinus fangiana]